MRKAVITLISSVGKKDSVENIRTVNHIAQSFLLVGFSAFLDNGVHIGFLPQIIECVQMQQAIVPLAVGSGIIAIRVRRIGGNGEVRAIDSQEPVAAVFSVIGCECLGELPKQKLEGFRQDFVTLLSQGRGRRKRSDAFIIIQQLICCAFCLH